MPLILVSHAVMSLCDHAAAPDENQRSVDQFHRMTDCGTALIAAVGTISGLPLEQLTQFSPAAKSVPDRLQYTVPARFEQSGGPAPATFGRWCTNQILYAGAKAVLPECLVVARERTRCAGGARALTSR